jgi:hypothetical protein
MVKRSLETAMYDMRKLADTKCADISRLSREEAIEEILHFPSQFKFDFTRQYLESLSDEQLHHMLLAAYLCAAKK